jgi:ATP-dependent helicase HrpA
LEKANACEVKMAMMTAPVFSAAVGDIRAQLNGLFRPNFVLETPPKWLMEYDRYLEGVTVRLEKLQGNLTRDQSAQQELQALETRMNQETLDEEVLKEFQGLMQEFRISLFAQALGTRVPVSKKRLEQALNRSAA